MDKKIVVCGSIAYDHVMTYMGEFEDSLKGQDLSKLSVSFLAMNRDVHFGGCAGNIGYNLSLLGISPFVVGVVGNDFSQYKEWMDSNRINSDYVRKVDDQLTASAFVLTDNVENQVTIFAPESMADYRNESLLEPLANEHRISIVLIGPDFPARMNKHVNDCKRLGLEYVFDPGQALPALEPNDLRVAIDGAKVLIANSYEMGLLKTKTGLTDEDIDKMAELIIETKGENGSVLRQDGESIVIQAIEPSQTVDPTGCGDAFRAGILKAIHENDDVVHGCRLGAAIAAYNVERKGTQSHSFTLNDLVKRMM